MRMHDPSLDEVSRRSVSAIWGLGALPFEDPLGRC